MRISDKRYILDELQNCKLFIMKVSHIKWVKVKLSRYRLRQALAVPGG
jgi:hypothetical protein